MKRLLFLLALFVSIPSFAFAGIIIVEDMEQTGGPMPGKTQMTITASGDQARVDVGKDISSIVNSKTGATTALMHSRKMAMQLPEGTFDSVKKAGTSSTPDLKPTGKRQTINGFECEEYAGKLKEMDVVFWITKQVENQKEILDQLGNLGGSSDPFKGALENGDDFPGVPIRTILKTAEVGTMTMTIVSIKNEEVPASVFEIPAGYQTMEMPKMQLPGGGAPAVPTSPAAE